MSHLTFRLLHIAGLVTGFIALLGSSSADAQGAGTVLSETKISSTAGGFAGPLEDEDCFGVDITRLGDLDGDGVADVAVGAQGTNDNGINRGAVWILFLNPDGTVRDHQKIGSTDGGFYGNLDDSDHFGVALCALGDLDGDGNPDLAVGAWYDDDGPGQDFGAVWILFLENDGKVKAHQKISNTEGGFGGSTYPLSPFDRFGAGIARAGDLDGDGVVDIAVGAPYDDDGGYDRGAVWILFLNSNGTVKGSQKISQLAGGFGGPLANEDLFGLGVGGLDDLDGDGVRDLVVGAPKDDGPGTNHGAVWILFLNPDGTVKGEQKICEGTGGFTGTLNDQEQFGWRVKATGDVDGDGVQDLAVGAPGNSDGGVGRGAVWILFLHSDGTAKSHQRISDTAGGFGGNLEDGDLFGTCASWLEDLDGDGKGDLAVGACWDDDGGAGRGAVWILTLEGAIQAKTTFRNAGSNPASHAAVTRPVIGTTYTASIDLAATTGHNLAWLVGYATPTTAGLGGGKFLLVNALDPAGELLLQPMKPGPIATFGIPVPTNLAFVGATAATQALHWGGVLPYALSNAQDLMIGF